MKPLSQRPPTYTVGGHQFYSLYVSDVIIHKSGWREYTVEIDVTWIFHATFAPCDWQMHPRGKVMTVKVPNLLPKFETGIREAARLHNRSIEVYEAALAEGKTPLEARDLAQFEAIYQAEISGRAKQ
jgi:hypothetical protein